MIKTKTHKKIVKESEFISLQCDICKKTFSADDYTEVQEFLHIRRSGGYGSVFGDETYIECDICQHCLHKFIKDGYREREG